MAHRPENIAGRAQLLSGETRATIDGWVARFPEGRQRSALIQSPSGSLVVAVSAVLWSGRRIVSGAAIALAMTGADGLTAYTGPVKPPATRLRTSV